MPRKKILFWGYNYMNYCASIREELESGIGDTYYCSLEFPRIMRLYRQLSASLYRKMLYWYHKNQIKKIPDGEFDYVYFVHVKEMDISLVRAMREKYPKAKFILYYWDSIKTIDYRDYIPLFDRVYSFDHTDCANDARLTYLPLFYTESLFPKKTERTTDYDLAYIVSVTQERRYQYLVGLREYARKNHLKLYEFAGVYSKTYVKYFLKNFRLMKGVHLFKSLSLPDVYDIFSRSRVIVDFPNNYQSGLTMRTFETLGLKRKLLTCNERIKNESCYSLDNVFVTSPDHLESIPADFFRTPFHDNPAILDYSLGSWVRKQFQEQ